VVVEVRRYANEHDIGGGEEEGEHRERAAHGSGDRAPRRANAGARQHVRRGPHEDTPRPGTGRGELVVWLQRRWPHCTGPFSGFVILLYLVKAREICDLFQETCTSSRLHATS